MTGLKIEQMATIEDLRCAAQKRVARTFYQYVDSGSYTGSTYKDNEAAFQKIKFKQKLAVNTENRSLTSQFLGKEAKMPVALAPVGLLGMQYGDGEILAAQAAEEFNVPFVLSTMSICSIEQVKEKVKEPFWFQLYLMRDREFIWQLIERAQKAECSALVLTLDLPIMGQIPADVHNGLAIPPRFSLCSAVNMALHLKWALSIAETSNRNFGNLAGKVKNITDPRSLASWSAEQFDPSVTWDTVKEVRAKWQGKLVIKGISNPEDAQSALNCGADALIVSNHGGRQLDGAIPTIEVLPQIVKAVGDKTEVYLDSGVRSGMDVLRAKALGAKGVFIGRAYTYGLGAFGKNGVTKALDIIYKELSTTMAFCGLTDINQADSSILYPNTYPNA